MAFSHGSKAALYLVDAGGVERNISAYLDSTGFTQDLDTADTSTLSNGFKTFVTGLADAGLPLSGFYDPTIESYIQGLIASGLPSAFKYFPAGSASGHTYHAGTAYVTGFSHTTGVGGAATFTSSLKPSSQPTFGTA